MVVRRQSLVIAAAVLLGLGLSVPLLLRSEEARIRRHFRRLEASLVKEAGENELAVAARIMGTAKYFADPSRLHGGESVPALTGAYSPRQVAEQILGIFMAVKTVRIAFHDLAITVTGDHATVNTTVEATGTLHSGEKLREARELVCTLRKVEGDWRFAGCRIVDVLTR